mgnify:FL=1
MIGKYIKNQLVWFDQGVNSWGGGNPDCTISACAYIYRKGKFWGLMEKVIDYTFKPIDGPQHCMQAYHSDSSEDYTNGGYLRKGFIGLCVLIFCVVAILPIKIIGAFK